MTFVLTTRQHQYTIASYLAACDDELAAPFVPLSYEELFRTRRLSRGVYIFADIDRLSPPDTERAGHFWRQLSEAGCRVLNHPTRSMRRYELLRTLYERGINDWNVYRIPELRMPQNFPVFLRQEDEHGGNISPLLHSPAEVDAQIEQLRNAGKSCEGKMLAEFCDTKDANGIYRKYAAHVVGPHVIPRHLFFGNEWMLKGPKIADRDGLLVEETEYVRSNPHEAELRRIFQLARIEYGRIDYSVRDGKITVWEINTNPMIMRRLDVQREWRREIQLQFLRRFRDAFTELAVEADCGPASPRCIRIESKDLRPPLPKTRWETTRDILRWRRAA